MTCNDAKGSAAAAPKLTSASIGIIGGAGPMAGALLLQRLIEVCQRDYACQQDADFPRCILINVPFAQMLLPGQAQQAEAHVAAHLQEALDFLESSAATRVAIACNTLHAFLPPEARVLSLIDETERQIAEQGLRDVLVLASSTSRGKGLYRFAAARWPDKRGQKLVDHIIDEVLAGRGDPAMLRAVIEEQGRADAALLGCSELSVLMQGAPQDDLIDPLELIARALCAA